MTPDDSTLDHGFTQQLKILIPEGYRDGLSVNTDEAARICMQFIKGGHCATPFRAKIRAMITKIPGFFFMSYR